MSTSKELEYLAADFPKEDIHWRAQTVTKKGDKALALAYLDARNVMDRLDEVCGIEGWQDRYEVHGSKTICYISVKIDDEWVTKADGAGDTAVEAEKGSLSDAFKRSAVKWGIGRYLYSLDAVWCPCETYTNKSGKATFSKFTTDPWSLVRGQSAPKAASRKSYTSLVDEMKLFKTVDELSNWVTKTSTKSRYNSMPSDWKRTFGEELSQRKQALTPSTPETESQSAGDVLAEFETWMENSKTSDEVETAWEQFEHYQEVVGEDDAQTLRGLYEAALTRVSDTPTPPNPNEKGVDTNSALPTGTSSPETSVDKEDAKSEEPPKSNTSSEDSASSDNSKQTERLVSFGRKLTKIVDDRKDNNLDNKSASMKQQANMFGPEIKEKFGDEVGAICGEMYQDFVSILKHIKDPQEGMSRSKVLAKWAAKLDVQLGEFSK